MSAHRIVGIDSEHYVCVPCEAVLSRDGCPSDEDWTAKVAAFVEAHDARQQLAEAREAMVVARAAVIVAQARVDYLEDE